MTDNVTLRIKQGASFSVALVWKYANGSAKDLTGYTGAMQIRSDYNSNTVYADLNTSSNTIIITANTGTVNLLLSNTATKAIPVPKDSKGKPPTASYPFDLFLTSPTGFTDKVLTGFAEVELAVTNE